MTKSLEELEQQRDPLTYAVIGCAIEVHKELGPGLLESIYEDCMCVELTRNNIPFLRQQPVAVVYKGTPIDSELKYDLLIDSSLVEVKTVEKILPVHEAQLLSYMKLLKIHRGLILNFKVAVMRDGIKRLVL